MYILKRFAILSIMLAQAVSRYTLQDGDLQTAHGGAGYVLRVRDMDDEDKPREKLLKNGPQNLSMTELMAVLWGVGTRKEDVLAMSHRVLREYGERTIMYETNPRRLSEALDVPLTKACQIVVSFELGRRYFERRGGKPHYIRTAEHAYQYVASMADAPKEQLRGLYVNSRYQLIHDEIISIGSLTANIVHPREVFRPAIERGAVALIIAHNHPSGSLKATQEDRLITSQLVLAGQVLGIDLLDHLIITRSGYASIMEDQHE